MIGKELKGIPANNCYEVADFIKKILSSFGKISILSIKKIMDFIWKMDHSVQGI